MSRPPGGAWIETLSLYLKHDMLIRRAPQGARGLKLMMVVPVVVILVVAPPRGRVD